MSVVEGAGVKLDIKFRDPEHPKRLLDPGGTVTATLRKPDDTTFQVVATKISDGVYAAEFTATDPGDWEWRAASDGPMPGVAEGVLTVRKSAVL